MTSLAVDWLGGAMTSQRHQTNVPLLPLVFPFYSVDVICVSMPPFNQWHRRTFHDFGNTVHMTACQT